METDKSGKPILWHQGLFLQPHHFQQFDNYLRSLIAPHNKYHTPFFYGCSRINVHESSLDQRIIEIADCELIFHDGTWVNFPGNALIYPRSFEELSFDEKGDKPITVYLGIRKWDAYNKNVTSIMASDSLDSIGTRFISSMEAEEVRDIHEGGVAANIRRMDYLLKVFWDNEIDKYNEYLTIPVLQLELIEDKVCISKNFIAPTYTVAGSEIIIHKLKELRENLISRCRVFESYKFAQGFQSADFDAHFLPYLLVLNSLNRALPVLNHIIERPDCHPHAVYGVLRQIVGELSTFTNRVNALGQLKDGTYLLPAYDHENLFFCFNEAIVLIEELLKGISLGGESIFNMIRKDEYFTAEIPVEEFRDYAIFFIVVKTGGDPEGIINDFHNLVKIGTPENIDNLVSRALPGVPVRHRLVPPAGMPKHENTHYFRINSKDKGWQEIKRTGDICLYWDNAPDDASIDIVVSQT